MKKFIIITILFILLIPGTIFSQKKVGTTGDDFLLMSPSIRSNGMGQVGVALVDEYSNYFNPGSLGLYYLKDEISITPWADTPDMENGINFGQSSLSIPVLKHKLQNGSSIGLSFALSYNRMRVDKTLDKIDYDLIPYDRYSIFTNQTYNASVGFGYNGVFQIGGGLSFKHFYDYGYLKGVAIDLGVILRFPVGKLLNLKSDKYKIVILPSFGFSHSNKGPLLRAGVNERSLISVNRTGIALTLGINKFTSYGEWRLFTLISSIEDEDTEFNYDATKKGLEIDFVEAFTFRLGDNDRRNTTTSTWGFTINSGGIFKLFNAISSNNSDSPSKTLDFLANRLTFQYSEAHYDKETVSNTEPFRGISIKYKLSRIN